MDNETGERVEVNEWKQEKDKGEENKAKFKECEEEEKEMV